MSIERILRISEMAGLNKEEEEFLVKIWREHQSAVSTAYELSISESTLVRRKQRMYSKVFDSFALHGIKDEDAKSLFNKESPSDLVDKT